MPHATLRVGPACTGDVDGILHLMTQNLAANGGSLSAAFSREQIGAMLGGLPLIVAHHEDKVVGFLMTATRESGNAIPIIQAMLQAYPGSADAYVYGPICVAATHRGQRIAQAMFTELRSHLPGREGILFVRRDNTASLHAHTRMGMREVGEFMFRDTAHAVYAYVG